MSAPNYVHGQFSWVDLMAHDAAAAADFYGKLFGWTCRELKTEGGPPYSQFELDGKSVAGLGEMDDQMKSQGMPPIWSSYINVNDVEEIARHAADLGARVAMPPMQVYAAGWLTFLSDPGGAHIGFWQKNEHVGAEVVNQIGSFCWNELAARDMAASQKFYGDLLGWTYEDNPGSPAPYKIIKNGDRPNGGIIQMDENWGEMPPCWSVYFTVEDADGSAKRVEQLGGKIHAPPFDVPVGRMAVVADPQGAAFNIIALTVQTDEL